MIIIDETGIEIVFVFVAFVVVGASLTEVGTVAVAIADISFVIDEQEFLFRSPSAFFLDSAASAGRLFCAPVADESVRVATGRQQRVYLFGGGDCGGSGGDGFSLSLFRVHGNFRSRL